MCNVSVHESYVITFRALVNSRNTNDCLNPMPMPMLSFACLSFSLNSRLFLFVSFSLIPHFSASCELASIRVVFLFVHVHDTECRRNGFYSICEQIFTLQWAFSLDIVRFIWTDRKSLASTGIVNLPGYFVRSCRVCVCVPCTHTRYTYMHESCLFYWSEKRSMIFVSEVNVSCQCYSNIRLEIYLKTGNDSLSSNWD